MRIRWTRFGTSSCISRSVCELSKTSSGDNLMRILMTGFTSTQVHGRFARYDRPSFVSAIKNGLIAAGHEVELRPVTAGEDLSAYDALVLGLFDAGSLGSMVYKWGAM